MELATRHQLETVPTYNLSYRPFRIPQHKSCETNDSSDCTAASRHHIVISRLHTFSFFTWLVFEFVFFFPSSIFLAAAMPAVFLRHFCVSFIIAPLGSFHLIALACFWRLFGSGINSPHRDGAAHVMTRMQETTLYLAAFFFFFCGLGQKICFSKAGYPFAMQANRCTVVESLV